MFSIQVGGGAKASFGTAAREGDHKFHSRCDAFAGSTNLFDICACLPRGNQNIQSLLGISAKSPMLSL